MKTRGHLRKFKMFRIAFRELVYKGQLPGIKKSSWLTQPFKVLALLKIITRYLVNLVV
ncbi:hypothetical protein EI200_21910 [Peribacillus simplex]|nr:hypothetical protein EI200_21910 [Peribacillus simplex]